MSTDPDVVVVGGGLAGLAAAIRCASFGLSVTVLEKGTQEGGESNARISTGIFHLAWQPMDAPVEVLAQQLSVATDSAISPELARAIASNAKPVLDWLVETGVQFEPSLTRPGYRWHVTPHTTNVGRAISGARGTDRMMKLLYDVFIARGQLRLDSRAVTLEKRRTGWRVLVRNRHGAEEWIQTRNVCLCDGGYQANPELLSRHVTPRADRVVIRGMTSGTGDALVMAQSVGGRMTRLDQFYGHILSADAATHDLWPYPILDELCLHGLLINSSGGILSKPARTGIELANMIAQSADPSDWSVVITAAQWATLGADSPPGGYSALNDLQRLGGTVYYANDAASMARSLGVPVSDLAQGIQRFFGARRGLALVGLPIVPGITFTMGGISVDEDCAVVDDQDQVIKGLFAAGSACGGIQGGPRAGYVGGLAPAAITGWIAGSSIARTEPI